MPRYEFFCHSCKRTFSDALTLAEYAEGEVVCPHCGGSDVERSWSAFYAIAARKGA